MQDEHASAGEILKDIRRYASDFSLPEEVSAIFAETYRKLEEFEADMQQHIHLENNILFPKAIKLEAELNDNS